MKINPVLHIILVEDSLHKFLSKFMLRLMRKTNYFLSMKSNPHTKIALETVKQFYLTIVKNFPCKIQRCNNFSEENNIQ